MIGFFGVRNQWRTWPGFPRTVENRQVSASRHRPSCSKVGLSQVGLSLTDQSVRYKLQHSLFLYGKSHRAGAVYSRRATVVALTTLYSPGPDRPWAVSMRRAYMDYLALQHIWAMCISKLKVSVRTTPSTFMLCTLVTPGVAAGADTRPLLPIPLTIISCFFLWFNFRLHAFAQFVTCSSSAETVALLEEGISK